MLSGDGGVSENDEMIVLYCMQPDFMYIWTFLRFFFSFQFFSCFRYHYSCHFSFYSEASTSPTTLFLEF